MTAPSSAETLVSLAGHHLGDTHEATDGPARRRTTTVIVQRTHHAPRVRVTEELALMEIGQQVFMARAAQDEAFHHRVPRGKPSRESAPWVSAASGNEMSPARTARTMTRSMVRSL